MCSRGSCWCWRWRLRSMPRSNGSSAGARSGRPGRTVASAPLRRLRPAPCSPRPDMSATHKTRSAPVNLPTHLLPTTVVGSYPQPEWLVDRAMLSKSVPRTRMHEMWRLPAEHLEEAQNDATIVAIRDMERAGIDIVTDGEIRRESYSNRFATALEGIDADNPATITARNGTQTPVPRVT